MQLTNNMMSSNALTIKREEKWFMDFLWARLNDFSKAGFDLDKLVEQHPPPVFKGPEADSEYAHLVAKYEMNVPERMVLLLALLPFINPSALDPLSTVNNSLGKSFTEFGGAQEPGKSVFLPTAETALFLLAGDDYALRFKLSKLFSKNHFFHKDNIVGLIFEKEGVPEFWGRLVLSKEYRYLLTTGEEYSPEFSPDFPASRINTRLEWDDLVLSSDTMDGVDEISVWLQQGKNLLSDRTIGRKIKRGYRSLFYGPSGTGKTLTASLLAKSAEMDVFRIDLSMVVSKYIGETEKNLAKVFDQAENRNWILFFDEADALFGKRTQTSSSNDRYANQEVSFLLQRIEDFPGLVILASNYKSNMDQAFMRRFQSIIKFPMPSENLRRVLFDKAFQGRYQLSHDIDINAVSRRYELSGGNINNILRYCAMMALHTDAEQIEEENFFDGLRKELKKVGKTL